MDENLSGDQTNLAIQQQILDVAKQNLEKKKNKPRKARVGVKNIKTNLTVRKSRC